MTEPLPVKYVQPTFSRAPNFSQTPQEHLLDGTSIGRVLDAFGEGASNGWGAQPLGLDDDSVQVLRDIGLFQSVNDTWINPLKGFNESLIRPGAAAIDAFFRAFPAVTGGVGKAYGEVVGDTPSQKEKIGEEVTEFLDVGLLPLMTYSNAGGYVAAGEGAFRGTVMDTARVNNAVDNLDAVMKPEVAKADALAMPEAPGFTVYHGSPHVFDAFDIRKVGAGEGNQMEGWGLYVAEERMVGQQYKQNLAKDRAIQYPEGFSAPEPVLHSLDMLDFGSKNLTLDDIVAHATKRAEADGRLGDAEMAKSWEKIAQQAKNGEFTINHNNRGALYEARIKADKNDFLDLDAPLAQQSQQVKDAIKSVSDDMRAWDAENHFTRMVEAGQATGRVLYKTLEQEMANRYKATHTVDVVESGDDLIYRLIDQDGYVVLRNKDYDVIDRAYKEAGNLEPDKLASEFLNKQGIKGNRYFDQGSREKKDGTRNYVLFDDKYIDVVKRNDEPIAADTPKQQKLAAPLPVTPLAIEPQYTGKAGNINLDKLNTSDDVKGAIVEAAQANDDFMQARRGVVTWADTEALAEAAGVDTSVLLKRNIGDAWNAHQIEAARNLLIESAKNVMEKRNAIVKGEDNSAALIDFQEAWTRHALIQEQVSGVTAEAGRALNILRKKVGEAKAAGVNDLSDVLKDLGGRAKAEEIIDALKGLDDPSKVSRYISDMQKPGYKDYALEYLYNAMLSNPATHAANLTGNALAQFWRIGETGLAGLIGAGREAIGSRTAIAGDRVYLGEEGARLWGMLQGAPEGLRAAWRAIKTETPSEGAQKLEIARPRAIPGVAGRIVRTPGTALMAADELFKVVANRASINAQAYRKATKAKLKGQDFADEVARLTNAPTKNMMKQAALEADYATFTKELGKGGKAVQNLLAQHPIAKFVVAPFFRTPVNLLKYAGERTPLSLASKEVRDILVGKKGAAARDEQFAKILLGSAVTTATFYQAMNGNITGSGPSDPAERAMWLLSGKQPYSVKIGDTYYSYARLEPFATLMGISADAAEISNRVNVDEAANVGTLLAYSASQNIMNKTWLKGLTDIVEAISDPERYGPNVVRQLVSRVVPAGVGQATRVDDPYLRDARNILDGIRSKLPGLSDNIYPKRDIFGQAIRKDGAAGPDMVSPIFQSRLKNDPVVNELTTLGIFPAKLDRQIRTVELNEKQYDDYQRVAGRLMYIQLKGLVSTPGWQNVPIGIRQDVLTKAISKSRETARTLMLMQYPEIYKKAIETKVKHMTGGK